MGVFDGLHLGHREVIAKAIGRACDCGGVSGVLTFDPHPAYVLAPDKVPQRLLADLAHQERLLAEVGVDLLIVVSFDRAFSQCEPEAFIGQLMAAPRLHSLAIGEGWQFGKKRRGDVALLEEYGSQYGVQIDAVPAVLQGGERISSTRIRAAIDTGNLDDAAQLLGRVYSVLGEVVKGKQLGRTLDFPTANLLPRDQQLPPDGVWVVEGNLGSEWLPGAANLGKRPTVDQDSEERILEVHLLDWQGDLYGRELEVRFLKFLRPVQKFAGLEELREQIQNDAQQVRDYLGS